METLAEGLGVPIKVFHTRRRTRLGDIVADDLSKNNIDKSEPYSREEKMLAGGLAEC